MPLKAFVHDATLHATGYSKRWHEPIRNPYPPITAFNWFARKVASCTEVLRSIQTERKRAIFVAILPTMLPLLPSLPWLGWLMRTIFFLIIFNSPRTRDWTLWAVGSATCLGLYNPNDREWHSDCTIGMTFRSGRSTHVYIDRSKYARSSSKIQNNFENQSEN